MELVKRSIHMNKLKCKSNMQITVDDDFNVPDSKPDIEKIIKEQGSVTISETNAMNGKLMIKGVLQFQLLYISEEGSHFVHNIVGELPFDEIINLDSVSSEDNISVKWELEDLTASLINSRKVSMKAILFFSCCGEEVYEEEAAVGAEGDDTLQMQTKTLEISQMILNRKDALRFKEDIHLPQGKPNISEILYHNVRVQILEKRLQEGQFVLKGELEIFLLYAGEEDSETVQYYETEIPFHKTMDCEGCNESMIPYFVTHVADTEVHIKPDEDGEERNVELDVLLDVDFKVYSEETIDILSDIYSTGEMVLPVMKEVEYRRLLLKNNNKIRVAQHFKVEKGQPAVLQICYVDGTIRLDEQEIVENGISLEGIVEVQLLYFTAEDNKPMGAMKGILPFSQKIDVKDIHENCIFEVVPMVEQINSIMLDAQEVEVKVNLSFDTIVFEKMQENMIEDMTTEKFDLEKLEDTPGMVGYIVQSGDSLWTIAKRFYTTVEELIHLNELEKESVEKGQQLLVMKKVDTIL